MNAVSDQAIVVSGAGCVLPGCDTPAHFWQRLLAGRSAISPYEDAHIDSALIRYFGRITPEQSVAAGETIPFKLRRYGTPCSQWGVQAARDALSDAGLDLKQVPDHRRGLFTAQGDYMYPSVSSFAHGLSEARRKKTLDLAGLTNEFMHFRGADTFFVIKCLANNLLAIASLVFEMRGDCAAFVQDDSAVVAALRSAVFSLRHGYCDVALLICAGSYNEVLTLAELYKLGYLSACVDGASSLRPFDLRRDGAILGEGAIALVLETAAHARRRQARPIAGIGGIGSVVEMPDRPHRTDAYRRCARQALSHALNISDVGAIVAGARGGYAHDQREVELLQALQETCDPLPTTCATPITGSLPACPTEWLAAMGMLRHGLVPPIANLEQPMESRLKLVQGAALPHASRHVLAMTASHVGNHAAVLFSHPRV